MFFIIRPHVPPTPPFFHPHRRHERVKHRARAGRCHRSRNIYPNVFVDPDEDEDYFSRWAPHCRTGRKPAESETANKEGKIATSSPQQESSTSTAETSPQGTPKTKALESSSVTKMIAPMERTVATRHQTTDDKTVFERTPVHREETKDAATISMDVSGFSINQLQVCVEVDQDTQSGLARPVLMVSGERTNILGDKFKIRRRFLLERKNLADNLQDVAISANFSQEGILTIHVPKKMKEPEKEPKKVSRTIPVQQQQPNNFKEKPKESGNHDKDKEAST